jgi:drug/metabolite transporter (DMT)-like permease
VLAALATVYVVWGSTYLAIRVMVETMPPLLSAGLRFLASGGILYVWLWFHGGRPRLRIGRRELLAALVIGILFFPGGNGLVTLAEKEAPSGLAALIIAAIPLWVIVFRLVSRERVPRVTLAGVAAGFVGVGILVAPGSHAEGVALWSLLTLVAAAFSWALGSFISPRMPLPRDLLLAAAAEQVLGGLVLLVIGFAAGEALNVGEWSAKSIGGFAYLVTAGSLLAFTAYIWLLHNVPISTVATYAFVNPVVAVLLGWWILSEQLTVTMLVAAVVIVASVALVVRTERYGEPTPSEVH